MHNLEKRCRKVVKYPTCSQLPTHFSMLPHLCYIFFRLPNFMTLILHTHTHTHTHTQTQDDSPRFGGSYSELWLIKNFSLFRL